ncbi:zydeco [Carabus blaptoides fortunei]
MENYVTFLIVIVCSGVVSSIILDDNVQLGEWGTLAENQPRYTDLILDNPRDSSKENTDLTDAKETDKVTRVRFHYLPLAKLRQDQPMNSCMESSSADFPKDVFTMEAKRYGAVVLHFIFAVYCFGLLAVVCNDYFLPSVELICEKLNLSQDVAAATFMAIATSAPEFFVNVVGTFVTESDIGVGTIVGSALFNTLGVAALGGLAASQPIKLDWWPITRDSIIYILTISTLLIMSNDERIEWHEAMLLLIFYIGYFFIMWQNKRIYNFVMNILDVVTLKGSKFVNEHGSTGTINYISEDTQVKTVPADIVDRAVVIKIDPEAGSEPEESFSIWIWPKSACKTQKAWWIFSWPIKLILMCTIPDCKRYPKLFPITFLMCIAWIGSNSYLVSWMISIIGATFEIPDFVMGLTFLAAGGCLPEAISIVILSRRGQGGMGVSNSLGANTLDILLCLGLPWFIKSMIGVHTGKSSSIPMDSDSLFYTIMALVLAVVVLYTTVSVAGYKLNKKVGIVLIVSYVVFLAAAILLEMFWIYDGKILPCDLVQLQM